MAKMTDDRELILGVLLEITEGWSVTAISPFEM